MTMPGRSMRSMLRTCLVLVVATGSGIASATALAGGESESDQFAAQLRDAGITPDAVGLGAFLALHAPSDELRQHYRGLLARLGDADFFVRESAMLELHRMPLQLPDELAQAAQSSDAEQRWRAAVVKSHVDTAHRDLLYAAFIVIREGQLQGLAAGLLQTIPYCGNEPMQSAMTRALEATAARDDVETLRSQIAAEQSWVRIAAAAALDRALGDEALCDLLALLGDPDDLVRVSTAELLARRSLPDGHRLVLEALRGRAVELDAAGAEVWGLGDLPATATCARRLPNGNIVVATLDGALTEYDSEQAVVRATYLAGGIREVTVLPTERLLVVTDVPGHIIELGIDRREVWRSPRVDHLASACPAAEDGFVAVCLRPQPRLLSISRSGAVEPLTVECDQPCQVRQGPSGGLLILDAGGISLMANAGQPAQRVIEQKYLRSMAPVQF